MADTPTNNTQAIIQYFRLRADERLKNSSRSYGQAINSLAAFVNTLVGETPDFASEANLTDWLVQMCIGGMTVKTAIQYFNIVGALYGAAEKDDIAHPTDAFRNIKAKIKNSEIEPWQTVITNSEFNRLLNLTRTASTLKNDMSVAVDLMMMSLLNGCKPLRDVAMMKTSETTSIDEDSVDIAKRQSSPRRKYVFDLHQSTLTEKQLDKYVSSLFIGLLQSRNLPFFGSAKATIETYWAYAALHSGISATDIVATIGHAPKGIPFLSLVPVSEISAGRRYAVVRTVAEVFVNNPYHWYAMRLRPHVSYTEITKRLEELSGVDSPLLFYPYEEITRRTGRKLTFEKRPVIKDVVFFHSRVTDIPPMFRQIGDLAWCYTVSGKTGSTYAAIPGSSFKRFQETIGRFTPDYEVAPIGGLTPRPGDRVVAVGGIFDGLEADICSIAHTPVDPDNDATNNDNLSANTIYQLQFFSPNGLEWRLNLDARQTQPSTV